MAFKDRLFALLFTSMIIYASTLDKASAADSIQGCGGFVEVWHISYLLLITTAFLYQFLSVVINFFEFDFTLRFFAAFLCKFSCSMKDKLDFVVCGLRSADDLDSRIIEICKTFIIYLLIVKCISSYFRRV